jgi:hypothetical protein
LTGSAGADWNLDTIYVAFHFADANGNDIPAPHTEIQSNALKAFAVDLTVPANAVTGSLAITKYASGSWGYVTPVSLALAPAPAPAPVPAPVPVPVSNIAVQNNGNNYLQIGDYWVNDGIWGAGSLTQGTYTDINGSTYEQAAGISKTLGPNGEISWRTTWKWPTGTTEVKSYPSAIAGSKPGCANTWITPCGANVVLPDGSTRQVYPSGATPNSVFPQQLPIAPTYSSFAYQQNVTPTGHGHLSYDIWLQNTPTQCHGFGACNEITHEIMIPLTYWGGYGSYPGRNPGWYVKDETIDGRLWHIYYAPNFNGAWKFIVFEPTGDVAPGTLDLSKFINYVQTAGWTTGNTWVVSAELGIEPVDGVGDLTVSNYRVWK